MKSQIIVSHLNMILLAILILLIVCECICVEGSRPLRDQEQPVDSSFFRYIISRAYSGPSRRGAGH